ncbi:UNVERIFIED_CONTAM: hypothetical protein K2H54_064788 [Gekko kuhli]
MTTVPTSRPAFLNDTGHNGDAGHYNASHHHAGDNRGTGDHGDGIYTPLDEQWGPAPGPAPGPPLGPPGPPALLLVPLAPPLAPPPPPLQGPPQAPPPPVPQPMAPAVPQVLPHRKDLLDVTFDGDPDTLSFFIMWVMKFVEQWAHLFPDEEQQVDFIALCLHRAATDWYVSLHNGGWRMLMRSRGHSGLDSRIMQWLRRQRRSFAPLNKVNSQSRGIRQNSKSMQ